MFRKAFIVLVIYFFIALGMTYPLVFNFTHHVPGTETWSMDEYGFIWSFWWIKRAIFDLGVNPLQTKFIFYPIGNELITTTFAALNACLAIPIEFIFGYPAASNSIFLFAIVASAFGTFLLTHYLLRASPQTREMDARWLTFAAFVGGTVYGFASSRFIYASLGHYNFVSNQYLPFYALFFIKTIRERAWRNAIIAALFAAFAILTEISYAVFIALFSAFYAAFAWRARKHAPRWLTRLIALGAGVALFASPMLVPALAVFADADYQLPAWGHSEKLLVDLFGFITPTGLQPWNRNWVAELDAVRRGASRFVDVNTVFLGYVTLALAAIGAWVYRKSLGVWIAAFITFAILALGPTLHINGQSEFSFGDFATGIPMPFMALHYIPFLRENRVPNRFGILVMLSLAVLAAFAIAWASEKLKAKSVNFAPLVAGCLTLVILFEHSAVPIPLSDSRVPDVYTQIARDPGDFAILTIPFGLRSSFTTVGAEDTRTQFYGTVHQKFSLSGNTARSNPIQLDYFDRLSVFHSLSQVELYNPISPDVLVRDKAQAAQLSALYDLRYIVINAVTPNRVPYSDTRDATIKYVRDVFPLGEKIYDRDGVMAYRVNQPMLPVRMQIRFGTDESLPFHAEGWTDDEKVGNEMAKWVNRRKARLLIPAREGADYVLTLRAMPFVYPNAPTQTMDVSVNGQSVQKIEMKSGWENYSVTLPARALRPGMNDVILKFGYTIRPSDVWSSSGVDRLFAAAVSSMTIERK